MTSPKEAMLMAIAEGKKGAGFVAPNPLVGCVILDRDFNCIGRGHHARLGQAHAEINALANVQDTKALEGAHFYVTLEPCAHEGRTPSCAQALARLPIHSVTYGLRDPNPLVDGQGVEILRQAGKSVVKFDGLTSELEELAEIFLTNVRERRPFVALKVASSLDGKIALPGAASQWITGEAARLHVQFLRGQYDAVLVGAGTFLHDNPRLNSRDPRFTGRRSRVVLLDPKGRTFAKLGGSALLSVRAPEDVIVVGSRASPSRDLPSGVRFLEIPVESDGNFVVSELLNALFAEKIYSLFVEGGAHTFSAFLQARLTDRLYLYLAPKIFGNGLSWYQSNSGVLSLKNTKMEDVGGDVLVSGIPEFQPAN